MTLSVGCRVEAQWPPLDDGFAPNWATRGLSAAQLEWYPATVVRVHTGDTDTFDLLYDDGGRANGVGDTHVRLANSPRKRREESTAPASNGVVQVASKRPRNAAAKNIHCPAQPQPNGNPSQETEAAGLNADAHDTESAARSAAEAAQTKLKSSSLAAAAAAQQRREEEEEEEEEEDDDDDDEEDAGPVDTAVYTAVVTMCAYETGRQESNIMAYIAPPIIARQQAALGQSGVDQVLQLSNQVYHQGVPFEPEQMVALEALCDGGKAYIKRKYGAKNGCNGSRAAFMAIKQALRKQSEALAAGDVQLWDEKMARMPESFCPNFDIPKDVWETIPDGHVSYDEVYKALESVQIPVNTSRLNVKMRADQVISGMCLGVVNARANGIVVSSFALDRPRLTELLARFAKQYVPDFKFTSIQVNKNYMSAMHCDKNNLGNSYIVGVGDYTDGALWVHEKNDVQCHNKWVQFDGNIPHCTLPYTGTRYTLIYFSNQSYDLLGKSHHKRTMQGQVHSIFDIASF
eukprot:COSAG05_NODE_1341_length_5140_cov_4.176949_6_plen_517_part_00